MTTLLTLQDVAAARRFYERGFWRSDTLYTLLRDRAQATPDRFFIRDTNSRLTYRRTLQWVDTLAESLHDAGLRPGERVSIWLPSSIDFALIFLACSRMGYVANTSLHRDYSCAEIVNLLNRVASSAFFAQPLFGADGAKNDIFEMAAGLPRLRKVYSVDPTLPELSDADKPRRFSLELGGTRSLPHKVSPDEITYLAFTSGTTGLPKGVMHSDNTLLANGRPVVKDWELGADTVVYSMSTLSHNIGIVGLMVALVAGGEFIVHTPADARRVLDRIVETGATYLLGVPTHAIDLLVEARRRGMTRLGKANAAQLGGAPVPPAVIAGLAELGVRTQNSFGMTENCSFQYTRPDDPPETAANTVGKPCDGFEIKIWRENDPDREVPPGEVGELGTRGACLMLGYFDDQMATEKAFNRHGWFMTGDLARLDANGDLEIVGRKKDLIIRGGRNIHPARIEDFAMRHAEVIKAAAFPVRDERLGEKVCLAVIARTKGNLRAADLLSHLEGLGLPRFDMPEYYVELDQFPLTPSGKILKRALIEMVAAGTLTPEAIRWTGPQS